MVWLLLLWLGGVLQYDDRLQLFPMKQQALV
jgi:hypothetical protein